MSRQLAGNRVADSAFCVGGGMRMVRVLTRETDHRSESLISALFQPLGEQTWHGLSDRRYTHTIYKLVGCPAPVTANWVLVRRSESGHFEALATGYTQSDVASVNLADIRHQAARIGATEVHLDQSFDGERDNARVASEIAQVEGLEHRVA